MSSERGGGTSLPNSCNDELSSTYRKLLYFSLTAYQSICLLVRCGVDVKDSVTGVFAT